ncbi:hypothetical protein OEZ86_006027 [Tetradesmus obliquus]|nr:hypothetical protein OEZ86_006027 [Tetradesmus obliquus]
MDSDTKKLIRAVVRRVHPDLFTAHPFERQRNSDSLKALNSYVEQVARGITPRSTNVEFWVKDGEHLTRIDALLPSTGSLGPLFYAFSLITEEELKAGTGRDDVADTNFLEWLRDTVFEAVKIAEQHESLKLRIRESRANIEYKYQLASLQVGSEFAVGPLEQQRQIEALRVLDAVLASLISEEGMAFAGLNFHVYHPDTCPLGAFGLHNNEDHYGLGAGHLMRSHVADDGCLHVVADRMGLREALKTMDLERARVLTKVTMFWLKRVRDLSPVLRELLGVQNVWCDTRTEQNSQNFVLWAGYILEQRDEVARAVGNRQFTFSLLVHSDASSPMVDWSQNSSILQVRSDCPPRQLVEFLVSDTGVMADQAAAAVQITKKEEQELLERIRQEFGAKHVVRVCSMFECDRVLDGARRLLEYAPAIKQSVDLRGASLAIDDCYEVWGSGFISIPYDFTLQELQPQLVKLLSAKSSGAMGGNGSSAGAAREQMRPAAAVAGYGSARARAGITGSCGAEGLGLCSRYALQGQDHLGWGLRSVAWPVAVQQRPAQQLAASSRRRQCLAAAVRPAAAAAAAGGVRRGRWEWTFGPLGGRNH